MCRDGVPWVPRRDRVEAAGGSLSMTAQHGETVVEVRLPAPGLLATSAVPA